MSQVLLVRHGQASWGAEDYDVLSDTGAEQARVLGRAFAARGLVPDLVVHGSMRRHRETARFVAEAAGWDLAVDEDAGWDEFEPPRGARPAAALVRGRPAHPPRVPGAGSRPPPPAGWAATTTTSTTSPSPPSATGSRPRSTGSPRRLPDSATAVVFTSRRPDRPARRRAARRRRRPAQPAGAGRRQRLGHQGGRRPPRQHPGVLQRPQPPRGRRRPAHLPLT